MAILNTTNRAEFTGNNSSATAYVIPFRFDDPSWLAVYRVDAAGTPLLLSPGTDYTLTGSSLYTVAAVPASEKVRALRLAPMLQTLDSSPAPGSYAAAVEAQLDRTTMAMQDGIREAGVDQLGTGNPPPTNGKAARIRITGALVDQDGKLCSFPELYQVDATTWTWNGAAPRGMGYEPVLYYASRWIAELRIDGTVIGKWQAAVAANGGAQAATGWAAVSPSTGTPVLSLLPAIGKTPAVLGGYFDTLGRAWVAQGTSPNHVWVQAGAGPDEFVHDFSKEADGTTVVAGSLPQVGSPYLFRLGGPAVTPTVVGGKLREPDPAGSSYTWYLGQQLPSTLRNFGAVFEYERVNTANTTSQGFTILIMPEYVWLDALIHVRVQMGQVDVDISTRGGVNGFRTWSIPFMKPAGLEIGKRYTMTIGIEGDTMSLCVAGQYHQIVDPRIAQCNGRYVFFEQYEGSFNMANSNRVRVHRVWANADSQLREGLAYQPKSTILSEIASGGVRGALLQASATGGAIGRFPAFNTQAPLVTSVSSPAGASAYNLLSRYIYGGMLAPVGTRFEVKASGTFAANANNKTLACTLAGTGPTTGAVANNGGSWDIEVQVTATTTASHQCWGKITCTDAAGVTTVYQRTWSFSGYTGTTLGLDIRATASAAGDIVLHQCFTNLIHPIPENYL